MGADFLIRFCDGDNNVVGWMRRIVYGRGYERIFHLWTILFHGISEEGVWSLAASWCIWLQSETDWVYQGESYFDLYYDAKFCPGEIENGIDDSILNKWINAFEDCLRRQNQSKHYYYLLGKLFAYSSIGTDGYYPHESIREIIEKNYGKNMQSGYVSSEINSSSNNFLQVWLYIFSITLPSDISFRQSNLLAHKTTVLSLLKRIEFIFFNDV